MPRLLVQFAQRMPFTPWQRPTTWPPWPSAACARHNVRAFYRHLLDTCGLKELQAVCTVMRKLLLAIHIMFRNRTTFDSRRFFSPTETTT